MGVAVTEEEIRLLSSRACVAFAARCARWMERLDEAADSNSQHGSNVDSILQVAELIAERRLDETFSAPLAVLNNVANSYGHIGGWASFYHSRATDAAQVALEKAQGIGQPALIAAAHCAAEATDVEARREALLVPTRNAVAALSDAAERMSETRRTRLVEAVKRDYGLLAGERSRYAEDWRYYDAAVPEHFFALHSEFDAEPVLERRMIVDVSDAINAKLIAFLHRNPRGLYMLKPRQFEELVAELFSGFGFDVELTAATRDGGRDIVAVKKCGVAALKYLIECKRYAQSKKIGVAFVRALHGVTAKEGANKGILATTGEFSRPAQTYLTEVPWLLEGRDFNGLVRWLDLYQKGRMSNVLGLE